ncbi:MAG: hypothetical protein U0232_18460 [Thermomicrobiales bacterium]
MATACELVAGESWLAVAPSLLRRLRAAGEAIIAGAGEEAPGVGDLPAGVAAPIYQVTDVRMPEVRPAAAWYVRVPNLSLLSATLPPRWAAGCLAPGGPQRRVRISFYREGCDWF